MRPATVRFLALFLTAIALGSGMAHLLEMPNKILLTRADYLTVQQIYRGWALLAFVAYAAIGFTLLLAIQARRDRRAFALTLAALLLLIASQGVFWTFTFPVNQSTNNWTNLPDDWEPLRSRWEYSHAAGALLTMAALAVLIAAVVRERD